MKKVKLTESAYNNLINEISYGTVSNASYGSENIFYNLRVAFDDFYDCVKYNADTQNRYIIKIKEYADAIDDILMRKGKQRKNFDTELNKVDTKEFYGDEKRPDEWEDIEKADLKTIQKAYPKDISNHRFDGKHLVEK